MHYYHIQFHLKYNIFPLKNRGGGIRPAITIYFDSGIRIPLLSVKRNNPNAIRIRVERFMWAVSG